MPMMDSKLLRLKRRKLKRTSKKHLNVSEMARSVKIAPMNVAVVIWMTVRDGLNVQMEWNFVAIKIFLERYSAKVLFST